jgi:hypothetical protein
MILTTMLPYKFISFDQIHHIEVEDNNNLMCILFFIIPMIVKVTNNTSNKQYPMCWFNKHRWTTRFKVLVITQTIDHVSSLGTLACQDEVYWMYQLLITFTYSKVSHNKIALEAKCVFIGIFEFFVSHVNFMASPFPFKSTLFKFHSPSNYLLESNFCIFQTNLLHVHNTLFFIHGILTCNL